MARITKRAVNALTAREREYMLWDHDIKGFGVRVHPSGRKVSLVKYGHQGRVVKKTIGPHDAIPPAAARARVAEIITAAKTGRDLAGRGLRERDAKAPAMHELALPVPHISCWTCHQCEVNRIRHAVRRRKPWRRDGCSRAT